MYSIISFFKNVKMTILQAGDYRKCTKCALCTLVLLRCAFSRQNLHHFISSGIGSILLEIAGNGQDGIAHANLGYAVRAAGGAGILGGSIGHRVSFQISQKYVDFGFVL